MKKLITIICTCLCLCLCLSVNAEGLVTINVTNNVEGYIGLKIKGQIVDIKLDPSSPDATFNNVNEGDDITEWFTNIPKGLYAEVNEIVNNDELKVEINGVVDSGESEGSTKIEVTIPKGYINYGLNIYEDDVSNEPSKKAKYILETFSEFEIQYYDSYEIKGEVGKELTPQDIVVEILSCGSEADDFDYDSIVGVELTTNNGLTPTITGYDDVYLTITITYTGTPTNESHDLIHTTIPKENMINKTTDRVVEDREDVLFNIIDNTPTPIEPEPDSPSPITPRQFVVPSTGVN